jgi:uncharacterized membrane protein
VSSVFHLGTRSHEKNNDNVLSDVRIWQLLFFILAHVLIFTVIFHTIYSIKYTPIGVYYSDYASKIMGGSLPYRDFIFEYPPFSLLFFILPRLVTSSYGIYSVLYQAEVAIFDLVGVFVVFDIARRLGTAPWKSLTVYTAAILAMGPITALQFDIIPAIMVLLALYFFLLGKHKTSWALIALGTMTKIYPVVVAPVLLIYYFRSREYEKIRSGIITFGSVCLMIMLPFLVLSPSSLLNLYSYHAQRGIQLESIYSSFLLVANKLGFISAQPYFSFGSWNVVGSIENIIAGLSTYLLIILLLLAYWFIYRQTEKGKRDVSQLGAFFLLAIIIVMITSKILSPQYVIWLIPFLPLLVVRWRFAIWAVFVAIGGLTYYIFPGHYYRLVDFQPAPVAALCIRNILLILLAIAIGLSLSRSQKSPRFEKKRETIDGLP